jgi:hypothetical protein
MFHSRRRDCAVRLAAAVWGGRLPTVLQLGASTAHSTTHTHPVCKRRFAANFTLRLLLILTSDIGEEGSCRLSSLSLSVATGDSTFSEQQSARGKGCVSRLCYCNARTVAVKLGLWADYVIIVVVVVVFGRYNSRDCERCFVTDIVNITTGYLETNCYDSVLRWNSSGIFCSVVKIRHKRLCNLTVGV